MTQFQIPPRPRWRGFYFALLQCNPIQAFTAAFLSLMQIIPPKLQNRLQGFTGAFLLIWPVPAHAIQQSHKPPAQRWRAYHQAQHPHRYQAPPPRRTLYSSAQPPIIIRYIRVRRCAPVMDSCQTVQYITDHASPAGSRCFSRPAAGGLAPGQWSRLYRLVPGRAVILAPSTRRAVQRRAARNHWRLSPQLFSGFRPITNRGQQ